VFFFFFLEKNKLILVSSLILWLNNVTSLSTSYLTSIYIYIYIIHRYCCNHNSKTDKVKETKGHMARMRQT